MTKKSLIESVTSLLESARSRDTTQGVLILEASLRKLERADSDAELSDVLRRLNQAFAGIEAHGYFTDSEFQIVRQLRTAEIPQ